MSNLSPNRLTYVFAFSELDAEGLDQVARAGVERQFSRGDFIFREGDPPQWFGVLISGRVSIVKDSRNGRSVMLRVVHAGDVFGELATFSSRPYSASARALENSTALMIPRDDFLVLFRRYPTMGYDIMLDLARRLREAHNTIQGMAAERVERRIVRALIKLAERVGVPRARGVEIGMRLTRKMLAELAGTTVETGIRVTTRLTELGLIECGPQRIVVRSLDDLRGIPDDMLILPPRRGRG